MEMFNSTLKVRIGTSLADQGLRLWASNTGGKGFIPGQGTKTPHAMQFGKKKKLKTRMHVDRLSYFSCVLLLEILWTVAHQPPLSKGLSRQEYWSGLPCPLGDLPNPGIEPMSPALAGRCFTSSTSWEAPKPG